MKNKILKEKGCQITQNYSNKHKAIDIVGENKSLDYIVAHTSGIIIDIQDGYGNIKGSVGNLSYGNFVKIKHNDNFYTLYAHMKNGLSVKKNQYVIKGQILGYMWDSGNANGKHLHFEILKDNEKINPLEYLNKDLPNQTTKLLKYKIGDSIKIDGVYVSSDSEEILILLINKGTITKIIENAKNPYLLDDGKIGWVNDNVIIDNISTRYLINKKYSGTSIVDALKDINVNSSYEYRKSLAKLNNIKNYKGSNEQNSKLLELLKKGILKY